MTNEDLPEETERKQKPESAKKPKNKRKRMVLFVFFCHILGFATSIHAVMGVRTEQTTEAD